MRKLPTRSDTKRAVQSHKMARGLSDLESREIVVSM